MKKVADELKEMAKLDTSVLLLEKIIAHPSDNRTRIYSKSVGWKMMNINKGITKFEKITVSLEQLKTKDTDELISTIIGGVPINDLQHVDCRFLLDSFSI